MTIGKKCKYGQESGRSGRFLGGRGLQACGVRRLRSMRNDWKWAEKAAVRALVGAHTYSRQCREKGSGVLGHGTKDSRRGSGEQRPVETPRSIDAIRWGGGGGAARRPRTRARPQVRVGPGPGREEGLSQPSTPPTMAGAAGRDRPCSFSRREIKKWRGGRQQFPRPDPHIPDIRTS